MSDAAQLAAEDRKHNLPFRQIVKVRVALFEAAV